MLTKRKKYDNKKYYFTLDDCPFCTKLVKEKIIFKSEYWFVMKNDNPYFDEENGLMAIPKSHSEFTSDLTKEEFADFVNIEKFMKDFFKEKQYFSFIRQTKGNKSVEHLHYHYLLLSISSRIIDGENYFKIKYN